MKKYLLMLFFLCLTVPGTASAEEYLNMEGSFQIAKAVKLGRTTTKISGGSVVGGKGGQTLKSCGSDCKTCNTTTGICSACNSNSTTLVNGRCKQCSSLLTGCTQCSSSTTCTKCTGGYTLVKGKCETSFTLKKLNYDNTLMSSVTLPVSQISNYFNSYPDVDIYDMNGNGPVSATTKTVIMKCSSGTGEYWTMEECEKRLKEGHYCAASNYSCAAKQEICMRENCQKCDSEGFCAVCSEGFAVDKGSNYGECVSSAFSVMRYDSEGHLDSTTNEDHSNVSNYLSSTADLDVYDFYTNQAVTEMSQAVALKCKPMVSPIDGASRQAYWNEAQCLKYLTSPSVFCRDAATSCPVYAEACEVAYNAGCTSCDKNGCLNCSDGYLLSSNGTCRPATYTLNFNDGIGTYSTQVATPEGFDPAMQAGYLQNYYPSIHSCTSDGMTINCNCAGGMRATKERCEANLSGAATCMAPYGQIPYCGYVSATCPTNCSACTASGTVLTCTACDKGYVVDNGRCVRAKVTLLVEDSAGTYTIQQDMPDNWNVNTALQQAASAPAAGKCSIVDDATIKCSCAQSGMYATKDRCPANGKTGTCVKTSTTGGPYCAYINVQCPSGCATCGPDSNGGTTPVCTSCPSGQVLKSDGTCGVKGEYTVEVTDGKGTITTTRNLPDAPDAYTAATYLKSKYTNIKSCSASGETVKCTCQTWSDTKVYETEDRCKSTLTTNGGKMCQAVYGTDGPCSYSVGSCGQYCLACTAKGTIPICSKCADGYELGSADSSGYRSCKKKSSGGCNAFPDHDLYNVVLTDYVYCFGGEEGNKDSVCDGFRDSTGCQTMAACAAEDPTDSVFQPKATTLVIKDAAGSYSEAFAGKTPSQVKNSLPSSVSGCSISGATVTCTGCGPSHYDVYATKARCDANRGNANYCAASGMNYAYCEYAAFACSVSNCSKCAAYSDSCDVCASGYTRVQTGSSTYSCQKVESCSITGQSWNASAQACTCGSGSNVHKGVDGKYFCHQAGYCPGENQFGSNHGDNNGSDCYCNSGYTASGGNCVQAAYTVKVSDASGTYTQSTSYTDSSVSSASALATKLQSANNFVSSCSASGNTVTCSCTSNFYATKSRCDAQVTSGKVCMNPEGSSVMCPYVLSSCYASNCSTCTANGTVQTCTACKSGYLLFNGNCIKERTDGRLLLNDGSLAECTCNKTTGLCTICSRLDEAVLVDGSSGSGSYSGGSSSSSGGSSYSGGGGGGGGGSHYQQMMAVDDQVMEHQSYQYETMQLR